jgi:hypothetical protein
MPPVPLFVPPVPVVPLAPCMPPVFVEPPPAGNGEMPYAGTAIMPPVPVVPPLFGV